MIFIKYFLILILIYKRVQSANILAIIPVSSPSHYVWTFPILKNLARNGHNITFISPDPEKHPTENITHMQIKGVYKILQAKYNYTTVIDMTRLGDWYGVFDWMETTCRASMGSSAVTKLKSYPQNAFDLIIMDMVISECFYPFVQHFGSPPVVSTSPYGAYPWTSHMTGDYEYPAVIPIIGDYTNHMSFYQRFWNTLFSYYLRYYRNNIYLPNAEDIAKECFGENITPLKVTDANVSIFLVNNDPIMDYPRPVPPNVIQVAGIHIEPTEKTSEKILEFLDSAVDDGFILFSLGSNVRSKELSGEKIATLLNTFKSIPQKVLWKWEEDTLPDKPENVMIAKWIPSQGNVLAHPNIRLFITHGGWLSIQEAIFYAVPMIGIPFNMDHHMHVARIIDRGHGVGLHPDDLSSKKLLDTIKEVINNPEYMKNIKKSSLLYRDQPQTPMERVNFWIEFLLRHGGAQHLKSPLIKMPFYATLNLDVSSIILLIIFQCYATFYYLYYENIKLYITFITTNLVTCFLFRIKLAPLTNIFYDDKSSWSLPFWATYLMWLVMFLFIAFLRFNSPCAYCKRLLLLFTKKISRQNKPRKGKHFPQKKKH